MRTIGTITRPGQLGPLLRETRHARGLTLEEAALAAGVGPRFLSELERGKVTVQLAALLRVVDALGLQLTLEDPRG
jgi:transcriptional regulator with XRE-family HTH domain